MSASSFELPVGSEIEFLQKYSVSIANVAEVHEAAIDVADVPHLLVPEELVIIVRFVHSVVLSLAIFIIRLILVNFVLLNIQVVAFSFDLLMLFFAPASIVHYM